MPIFKDEDFDSFNYQNEKPKKDKLGSNEKMFSHDIFKILSDNIDGTISNSDLRSQINSFKDMIGSTADQQKIISKMMSGMISILLTEAQLFKPSNDNEKHMSGVIAAYEGIIFVIRIIILTMSNKISNDLSDNVENPIGAAFAKLDDVVRKHGSEKDINALNLIARVLFLYQMAVEHIARQFVSHNQVHDHIVSLSKTKYKKHNDNEDKT